MGNSVLSELQAASVQEPPYMGILTLVPKNNISKHKVLSPHRHASPKKGPNDCCPLRRSLYGPCHVSSGKDSCPFAHSSEASEALAWQVFKNCGLIDAKGGVSMGTAIDVHRGLCADQVGTIHIVPNYPRSLLT